MKLPMAGAAFLSLIASNALAVSRYEVMAMTCAEVQQRIEQEGTAVLSYRSWRIIGLPIYGRYAKSQQFCPEGTVASPSVVPTSDRKYCPVRKCFSSDRFIAR